MTKVYANKSNANRAAKKALAAAAEGSTMEVWQAADGWSFRIVAPAAPKKTGGRKADAPTGMTAKVVELAARPNGATRAELNELTQWKGAPWKWFFSNPKGTGVCDRFGYGFEVRKEGRTAHYHVTLEEAR